MSFAEARIDEWRRSRSAAGAPRTDVRFAEVLTKDIRLVVISESPQQAQQPGLTEDEIERQLAAEGLIRVPAGGAARPREFKRINVGGRPVSEMIVEERG